MALDRYSTRTQPEAAAVAPPARSALGVLADVIPALANPVLKRLDERQGALEASALSRAKKQLETEGLALELELQKTAGPAGAGHVPNVQARRAELQKKIWDTVPENVRKSERASLQWQAIADDDESQATRRATIWQSEQETKYAADGLQDGLNATLAAIEAAPDDAAAQREGFLAALEAQKPLLGEETSRQVAKAAERDIMLASVRGLSKAGRFDEAEDLVKRVAGMLGVQDRSIVDNAIKAQRAEKRGVIAEAVQLAIQNGEMDFTDLQTLRDQGDLDDGQLATLRGQIMGRNAEALQGAVADRKAGRSKIDQAEKLGDITPSAANMLREQNRALVEKAQRELEAERAKQQQARDRVQTGNYQALQFQAVNGDLSESDIRLAAAGGHIGLDHASALLSSLSSGKANRAALQGLINQRALGVPLNPYDTDTRRALDLEWEAAGGAALFAQDVELTNPDGSPAGYSANAGTMAVLQAAREVGVIPPGAASALQGMAINGSDQQRQAAFDAVAQLWEKHPGAAGAAFPDGNDRVLKDALSWRLKTAAGLDPVEALRAVERENIAPADPVLKQRAADAVKLTKDITADQVRAGLKDGVIPFFGDAPPVPAGAEASVTAMYREAYTAEYLRSGSEELAKKMAQAAMKRVLGPTKVGTGATLMAYPPDQFYAAIEARKPGWMNEQLASGVQAYIADGGVPSLPAATKIYPGEVRLIADGQTAREVREQLPPSYLVEVRGATLPERWQFDPSAQIGDLAKEAQARKRVDERRLALHQSGLFGTNAIDTLAKDGFRDRAHFDSVVRAGGIPGPGGVSPGFKPNVPKTVPPDTLWRQLQGIDTKYGGQAG